MEVVVRQEDKRVVASMRTERKDACNGGFHGSKSAIVACTKSVLNACALKKSEEGHDKMVRMGDRVDVHRCVVKGGVVSKPDN